MKKLLLIGLLSLLLLSFVSASTWNSTLNENLQSYWKFNEASGSAIDSVGIHNLTSGGTVVRNVTGLIGGAVNFSSTGFFNGTMDFNTSDGFTLSMWAKESLVSAGASNILFGTNDASANVVLQMEQQGDGSQNHFIAYVGDGNYLVNFNQVIGNDVFSTWQHFVLTCQEDTFCNLYYNGNLINTDTQNPFSLRNIDDPIFYIGKQAGGNPKYFDGLLDEVGYWNRSMDITEVQQLYNGGSGITFQPLAVPDTEYPIFSNFYSNNGTLTGNGTAYFNATIINTNGTVVLEIGGTNVTALQNGNNYNASIFLTNGTYSYKWKAYGNGTSNNFNQTADFVYTVNNPDAIYPIFSNVEDNSYTMNGSGTGLFNVTVINTNGTVQLNFNGINYSSSALGNIYYVNLSLNNGTYIYYWSAYGNGTSKNYNETVDYLYVLNNTEEITPPTPTPVTTDAIYDTMNSSGAGFGIFLIYLSKALPLLLIGLAFVVMIVLIGKHLLKPLELAVSP